MVLKEGPGLPFYAEFPEVCYCQDCLMIFSAAVFESAESMSKNV
jgi:hypothetical protein